ncbi:YndJ family protein [Haloarcula litorea]|uniref:YndJ family protein n=1 Tax=Haloarcula litorea TaxID=3032579 RepID=UPI0023E770B5|nr:YndJ family protein [Halomicroarcula sp. GDY20]
MSDGAEGAIGGEVPGVAVTDASAVGGAVLWTALVAAGTFGPVERALALAPLVLVPLGLGMAATAAFGGAAGRLVGAAAWLQPVGAVLLAASLALPVGGVPAAALATPWLLVAAAIGFAAVLRTRARGGLALPETAADAGFAYLPVGATALLLHHLGVTFWFDAAIVFLTAVHFHYAGFLLPVLTGLTGRCAGGSDDRLFRRVAGVIVVGPALIAVGISFSPLVEVVAVGVFTVAVALFGGHVLLWVAPTRPRPQAVLLAVSALALPLSMALALGYGVSAFTGWSLGLDLATMVALHGSLNAFGFGLLGTVGWRLAVPDATGE